MKILFTNLLQNYAANNVKNSTSIKKSSSNSASLPILQNDVFVKSTNNIAFKGESAANDDMTITDALITAGIVGAPLLLAIASADYLAKHQNPEDIFTYDGMYVGNVKDFKVETDKIQADGEDGIFKVDGTGIDIDASKYDIADVSNGVYKNLDDSVDIDLLHNKYIDKANGIFIDPEAKISAIKVGDKLVNVNLPTFGSGYPTCPWDPRWNDSYLIGSPDYYRHVDTDITRSEYIKLYGCEPETDPRGIQCRGDVLPDRSLTERMKDFFTGNSKEKYDIFGRKFFDFNDTEGNVQRIALDEQTFDFLKEHHIKGEDIPAIANFINDLKLEQYIAQNCPDFSHLAIPKFESVEDFVRSVSHSQDIPTTTLIGEDLNVEDLPIPEESNDAWHDILKLIKESFVS